MKPQTILKAALATVMISAGVNANAKTEYHVYKKGSSCEITTRTPDKFKSQRGSSWSFIGKDTTRSGAKKIGKGAGCSSF